MKKIVLIVLYMFLMSSCKDRVNAQIETSKSDFETLTDQELKSKTLKELRFLRNEVFARKGYVFKSEDLNTYFKTKSWYNPNPDAKVDLTLEEENYINKIKDIEGRIKAEKSLSPIQTVDLEKERKFYDNNDFYINTELKGFINNDTIEDIIWIIDISTDDSLGGNAKEEYRLQIFLGTKIKNKFVEYLKSDSVIPCNNCVNWENASEYSFSNVKLENKTFHFSTIQLYRGAGTQGFSQENTFIFNFDNDNMILSKVIKDYQNYDTNKKKKDRIMQKEKVLLKDFNIYDWKYVDPAYISG